MPDADNQWATMKNMFTYCPIIHTFEAKDLPDLSKVTDMYSMFYLASNFNQDISGWNVTKVLSYDFFAMGSGLTCDHTPHFENKTPTNGDITLCK